MFKLTTTFTIFAAAALFAAGSAFAVRASLYLADGINLSTLPLMQ
jgi:hypothetical protein